MSVWPKLRARAPPKARGATCSGERGKQRQERSIACLGKRLLKPRRPPAHRFAETCPVKSLQGCFQLQQDMFAGKCPQSESGDTPAWGPLAGEVTKAALFQTNICRGLGTAPSSCSSAAAGRLLERLFAVPPHHRRPRPPLARLEVLIHAWLTEQLLLAEAGALGTDLRKAKLRPSGDRLSSETSSPDRWGQAGH